MNESNPFLAELGSLKFIDHYPLNTPWTAAFSAGFRDGWEDILRSWTRAARR